MEIDFERFEEYLARKDKRNTYYRPLTSLPADKPRNVSDFQGRDLSIFRRPETIGYTVRLQPHQRRTNTQVRSSSFYDSSMFCDKSIKLKVSNDIGMKCIFMRKPVINESFYMKSILAEKLKSTLDRDENNPNIKKYEKKKLKVVKGKTNSYKLKLKSSSSCHEDIPGNAETSINNVTIIGTRLL